MGSCGRDVYQEHPEFTVNVGSSTVSPSSGERPAIGDGDGDVDQEGDTLESLEGEIEGGRGMNVSDSKEPGTQHSTSAAAVGGGELDARLEREGDEGRLGATRETAEGPREARRSTLETQSAAVEDNSEVSTLTGPAFRDTEFRHFCDKNFPSNAVFAGKREICFRWTCFGVEGL